jgi:hypothetical protein
MLESSEALAFIVPLFDATWVFVITREDQTWSRVDLSAGDIEKFVDVLRGQIPVLDDVKNGKSPTLFDLGFSNDLYRKLFGSVVPLFAGKSHLLIAASGALDRFPMHLLVTERPKMRRPTLDHLEEYKTAAWLVRKHAISILPSVASFYNLRRASTQLHA